MLKRPSRMTSTTDYVNMFLPYVTYNVHIKPIHSLCEREYVHHKIGKYFTKLMILMLPAAAAAADDDDDDDTCEKDMWGVEILMGGWDSNNIKNNII